MDYKDYYKILGVPRTATQPEIKKAFRKLARLSHPDMKPGDEAAEQRFKDVNEANEVLSDPAKRRQYNELGANWEAYARAGAGAGGAASSPFGAGGPFAGSSGMGGQGGSVRYEFRSSGGGADQFSDFFRMFFGGDPGAAGATAASGAGQRSGGRARRAEATGGASMEDLLSGMGGGTAGHADQAAPPRRRQPLEAEAEISLDEAFHGTTRLVDVDGRRLEVKVPPGVDTGSRIVLRGKGDDSGGTARDLVIVPKVTPHAVFTRTGADLAREIKVTLREALLGGEIPVRTLKGRVLLTMPAGTQHGRTFRLKGQGMPRLKGEGSGDLYVKIAVVLPANLPPEARDEAARFLDLVDQPDPRAGS